LCIAASGLGLAAAALLGRFLPRLGPLLVGGLSFCLGATEVTARRPVA
jgi:hypothetical protein